MQFTTATKKGQIVIPAGVRAALGIKEGSKLSVELKKQDIVLKLVSRDYFENLAGVLKAGRKKPKQAAKRRIGNKGKSK